MVLVHDGRRFRSHAWTGRLLLGALLVGAAGGAWVLGCGARTALDDEPTGRAQVGAGAAGAGSGGGTGGAGAEAGQGGTPTDAGPPDAALPVCRLAAAEPPVVVHAYGDRDLHTPSPVVVSAGALDPGTGTPVAPARVAVQAVSSSASSPPPDGIEVGLVEVSTQGASHAIGVVEPFFLLGDASMTYAQMVRAPGVDSSTLALTWSGESGTELGLVSTEPWGGASVATILWSGASTPLGLAAGKGVGDMGWGYGGLGYGLTWDAPGSEEPFVAAVLDELGTVVIGPHPIFGEATTTGAGAPSILWSGEAYLLATGVTECSVAVPLCVPHSVVLSRVRPASGDAWDDSGIDLAGAIAATDPGADLGYASLAASADAIAAAWTETATSPNPNPPWSIWISRLDPQGVPIGPPVRVAEGTTVTGSLRLSGGSHGLLAVRAEDGDLGLPDDVPGRSRILLHQLDAELVALGEPVVIEATLFGSVGFPAAVAIDAPRGALVVWSGLSPEHGRRAVFAAFVPCAS